MKNIFIILFFLFAWSGIHAQAIVKGTGVLYTNGAPTSPVNVSVDAEICIDTVSGLWYEYNRDAGSWAKAGFRVQRKNISIAPTGAPGDKQSEIVINDVDSMYLWRSGAWRHINKVGDASITNEGILGVGAGSGTSSTLVSNTSTSNAVTINAAGILAISESTSSNGGSITLTATEVDGSVTNEGSLTVGAGTGTTSIINSNTSGSTGVTVAAGTGLGISESGNVITLTNSSPDQTVALTGAGITAVTGTYPNFTITSTEVDGSVTNEGSLTVAAGSGTTSIINSNTSGSTGVTVTAGTGLGISESGNVITLTNSSPDQTVSLTGAGITEVTGTYPNFTITSTEVDGSTTNELQTISNTSNSTSHTVTLSNAGGSVQLVEGANVTLTTTGTGSDGIVTVAVPSTILPTVAATDILIGTGSPGYQSAVFAQFTSSGMDVSGGKPYNLLNTSTGTRNSWQFVNDSTTYFTSSLGGSPFGHYVRGKNLLYYRQYFFFGGNENNVSGFNSEINGVNVITPGSTLTGVVNGVVNETTRKITLINESASNSLIISNQNTASIAANRFSIGSDYTLAAGKMISFVYDKSISRWVFYKPQGDIAPDQVVSLTGAGITAVTGTYPNFTVTSTEVDGSLSNEGLLGVGAGSGSSAVVVSNTAGANGVTINVAGGLNISETVSSNGGQITIDAGDLDQSAGNEIQTISLSDGTGNDKALDLSLTGGNQVIFRPGTGISLARTDDILTINNTYASVPSGTNNQTLRNSSGAWVANSFLLNTGTGVGVGRTPGKPLDVQGSIRSVGSGSAASPSSSSLVLENTSTNGQIWYSYSDNAGYYTVTEDAAAGSDINYLQIEPINGHIAIGDAGFDKKLNVEGTARLTNTTADTPTKVAGLDADGDLCEFSLGSGLSISAGVLSATGGGGGSTNYQTWRDDGTGVTQQPNANFVSNADIAFTLTNDGANTETEVTADIPAAAVEFAEMQNISTGSLIGRSTAGSGSPEQITVSTGLGLSGGNLTATDPSLSNEGSLTVAAGTSTTSIINSNTSGQTGITVEAGSGLGVAESGNTITLTNTAPDQTVSITGAGISSVTGTYPNFTVTSTEVDGSTTNELQTYSHSGSTSYTNTLSNSGGSFTLSAGGINAISHSAGNVTITATEVDGSVSNEGSLTVAAGTSTTAIINSNTSGQTGVTIEAGSGLAVSESGNTITLSATGGGGGGSPVVITPAQITATQDNYSPTDWASATVVMLSTDGTEIWGITGFSSTGFSAGHAKKIFNTSMAQIYIACNHPSSSASNRVSGTQDFILSYGRSVDIVFNGSTWMLSGESAEPDLYYRYNPGSVTAGDWGQIAFNAINSGSVNTHTSTDATHPVGLELSTLATTTGGGSISAPKTAGLMRRNTGHSFVESVVRTPSALSDATDSYICGIALGSGNVSALNSVNNIGIRYNHALNSGNWTLYAIDNAGSTTEVNLGVTVAANTRYNLRLELSDDASEGRAYVNGEMKGIISANMPISGSSLLGKVQMNKAAGTSDRRLIVSKLVTGLHIKY